ncbi:hypothetical protein FCL40_01125 [Ferrimonas sediminicola]|uniref:Integrase n=1 Tax=Ferrimonas sediminicola TaxID=2569538 RepID=A0A4U1BM43_9GAMM|nr:hypothetical protein [Ferrimonas sediminicola]TKB51188.1 hypothetical protein FCL40_01125 [Ferrimonas sediminicola]
MDDTIFFKPRSKSDTKKNLQDFIEHGRNVLKLYQEQGGFAVNEWSYNCGRKNHAMVFSKYSEIKNSYSYEPLDEPFLSFAKAYVRQRQSEMQVTSVGDKLVVLRTLYDALLEIHGEANVLKTNGIVQDEVVNLLNDRYPRSPKLSKYGGQLINLYTFLREKIITPALPKWQNPWKRHKSKAEGTDEASRAWQEERCPSQHQMLALADCFARSEAKQDIYWSSALVLLMFAPGRGTELTHLTTDSLHEDEGRLGVRWYAQKGYDYTIKWVPKDLEEVVREAFSRLIEISQPARDAAKFAYENPGKFLRHKDCITPPDFPENKPLNALQFAQAMGFTPNTINRLKAKTKNYDSFTAWRVVGANYVNWVDALLANGVPTYQHLAQYTLDKYRTNDWPNLPKVGRPIWKALLLIRENEFHAKHMPKGFSWVMPDINQLNDQLKARKMKNPIPTIFQRFELKDEDGGEIELTSHQLRVWLSTNAERGGMDAWRLAQWAGRTRVEDNRHYDLRTQEEREEMANALLELDARPTALAAFKMNLPVAYADLGVNRVGIADVTEWGFCVHDYAMSPCTKGGECLICKEHVCLKGMPKTLDRIKIVEGKLESQYLKAKKDSQQKVFGADRWESHLGWKLAHVRTQRLRMESDDIPDGTALWIPVEHDPSPVERSLKQRGYPTEIPQGELVDASVMAGLLGVDDA